jgi:hypothetical protein
VDKFSYALPRCFQVADEIRRHFHRAMLARRVHPLDHNTSATYSPDSKDVSARDISSSKLLLMSKTKERGLLRDMSFCRLVQAQSGRQ